MEILGKDILFSKKLREILLKDNCNIVEIKLSNGDIIKKMDKPLHINVDYNYRGPILIETTSNISLSEDSIIILEDVDIDLYNVYTSTEAAILWGKDESTVRSAVRKGKFIYGIDYRKAGRITLITKDAMIKVFGMPMHNSNNTEVTKEL